MSKITLQMKKWGGQFGKEYTDRNLQTLEEMEFSFKQKIGITRTEMNRRFISNIDHSIRILEVGSNIGNQLLILQNMGFKYLYGIELQGYAVELSKSRTRGINIIQGSAFGIPFKDLFFDLVFTSGLLIHIAPKDIDIVLDEIYRCTNKYIWGAEYYADNWTKINYRGHPDLLWKTDYVKLFIQKFPDLELIKEEKFKYINEDNIDTMFLLRKRV